MRLNVLIGVVGILLGVGLGRFAFAPPSSGGDGPVAGFPLPALTAQARFVPVLQGSTVHGFKLVLARQGSVLLELGLKRGDVIKAVGGHSVVNSASLAAAFAALEGKTTIEIDRNGEPMSIPCDACAQRLRTATWSSGADVPGVDDVLLRAPTDRATAAAPWPEDLVTADGPDRFRVRTSLRALLREPARLATQARVVPAFQDGEPHGFKLFAIRQTSLPGKLGLQNGDVVRSINGQAISTPEDLLQVVEGLAEQRQLTLDVVRRNQALTLTYEFQEDTAGSAASSSGPTP